MNRHTKVRVYDQEITIVGLTLVVSYEYYKGCATTYDNPADDPVIDILKAVVKCQPEVDAQTLLEAIKLYPRIVNSKISFDSGYDLLEEHILENPPL